MQFNTDVQLGERYKDSVSGYEGVATAVYFFLHGCERVLLEQWSDPQAKMVTETFDAPRLVHVETGKAPKSTKTGGWQPEPGRRGPQ